jgi:hypothetical protein
MKKKKKKKNGMIEWPNGSVVWYKNDKYHRECDLPAIIAWNGDKAWYIRGKLHRIKGPAFEGFDGTKEWWLDDKMYTEQDYYRELYKRGLITYNEAVMEIL